MDVLTRLERARLHSEKGHQPTQDMVKAILEAPSPENVSQLRSFLGAIGYYSKFLPNLSSKLAPLYRLLRKRTPCVWNQPQEEAFREAKACFTSTSILAHYDPQQELLLSLDASPCGLGAVLSQRFVDCTEKPVAFAGRSLAPAEKQYAQLDKEALAIVFGVKKFNQYLQYLLGRCFTIQSDHRIKRCALTLSAYDYRVEFKPGSQNSNADALSRLPLPETITNVPTPGETILLLENLQTTPVTVLQIRHWTNHDPLLSKYVNWFNTVGKKVRRNSLNISKKGKKNSVFGIPVYFGEIV